MTNRIFKIAFVVICITAMLGSLYSTVACDWYSWFSKDACSFSLPYHCSPGVHFSYSWEKELTNNDYEAVIFPLTTNNGKAYYTDDEEKIHILDISTGKIIRNIDDKRYLGRTGAISVVGDKIVVVARLDDNYDQTCGININTLQTEWTYKHPARKVYWPVVGNDKYVLISYIDDTLVCLDLSTGEEVWRLEGISTGPAVCNNRFIVSFKDHSLGCYSVDTLDEIWLIKPPIFNDKTIRCLISSNRVYAKLQNYDFEQMHIINTLYTIDFDTGDILWHSKNFVTSHGVGQSSNMSSVFLYHDNHIYCLNKDTGETTWEYSASEGDATIHNLISTEKTLYYTDNDGIYTIDAINGTFLSYCHDNRTNGSIRYADRRLLFINICGVLICFDGTAEIKYEIDSMDYMVNNNEYKADISPLIMNNRTLLPARYVIDPLGGDITWNQTEQKVICSLLVPQTQTDDLTQHNVVELWINKPTAKVNGIDVQIDPDNPDVVPTIINDRTMVPMRFLAESLGCEVEWVADTKEIILTYNP
jgi:outer membrane protein assembly factor BamB